MLKQIKNALLAALGGPRTESKTHLNSSFSQCGEDRVIRFIALLCGIKISSFIDIGANHPIEGSNTYLFYLDGAVGVCVEPIPSIAEMLSKERPRDNVLQVAIAGEAGSRDFFVIEPSTLSTFDVAAKDRALKTPNALLKDTIRVSVMSVNQLFEQFGTPDLLCVDIEGGDIELLKGWDVARYRPPIVCVEDIEYCHEKSEKKQLGVTDYLEKNGYMKFADTYINTILVDKAVWEG